MQSQTSAADSTPSSSTEATCPICSQFSGTPSEVQAHANQHLDTTSTTSNSIIDKPFDQLGNLSPAEKMMLEVEQGDYALALHLSSSPTFNNTTNTPKLSAALSETADRCYQSIIPTIMQLYHSVEPKIPFTTPAFRSRMHLATSLDFYVSNVAGLGWDCGYRNIQTMFSSLLHDPLCRSALQRKGLQEVPSILEIAAGIEQAWQNGIDREGANTLDGRLMGREVWIGAMEAQAILTNNGIRALMEEFETPTIPDRERMLEWVFQHFERFCAGQNCSIHRKLNLENDRGLSLVAPMFCQWPGHSVTIVGAKKAPATGNVSLVILDPTKSCSDSSFIRPMSLDILLRDAKHPELRHPRYQIVYVPSMPPRQPSPDQSEPPQANGTQLSNHSRRFSNASRLIRSLRFGRRNAR